jgi:hypothetical protein
MTRARKYYSRYYIVRGNQALWKDDPANKGSQSRQFAITSNEFNSTIGTFQVYGLEGLSNGIQNGKFATSDDEPRLLFDEDFQGLEAARNKFDDLLNTAQKEGFKLTSIIEFLEFEQKLKTPRKSTEG